MSDYAAVGILYSPHGMLGSLDKGMTIAMLLPTLPSVFMHWTMIIVRHFMKSVCNLHRTVCKLSRLCRAYMWHIRLCQTDAPRQRLKLAYSSVKVAKQHHEMANDYHYPMHQIRRQHRWKPGNHWSLRSSFGQDSSYMCWDTCVCIYIYIFIYGNTWAYTNLGSYKRILPEPFCLQFII